MQEQSLDISEQRSVQEKQTEVKGEMLFQTFSNDWILDLHVLLLNPRSVCVRYSLWQQ